MKTTFFTLGALTLALPALLACKKDTAEPDNTIVIPEENTTVNFEADLTTPIRNPLNGWTLYLDRDLGLNFWNTYDNYKVPGVGTVKISDYAGTAYLRTEWALFEPREGEYTWRDPSSKMSQLLKSARDRGLKLSFRIIVDGTEQGQNTPLYVRDTYGAEGYTTENGKHWSPYSDDPQFQKAYEKFIRALAEDFNDPSVVDFIDGYGLGRWGEGHMVRYKDQANKRAVFDWITDLYTSAFTKVPVVMNYHRLIGETASEGSVSADTEPMLISAIEKGYSLRHDAFGMTSNTTGYGSWDKMFCSLWNFKRPVIMEGGYVVSTHKYWTDPSGDYREGHPEDVRLGEFNDSRDSHVNMMDFRYGHETYTWFDYCFDLVQKFISEGGYRLYPDMVSVPDNAISGRTVTVVSSWNNLGWGYCPVNIPQWNQKYKVAFALLDEEEKPAYIYVDTATDLSTWLKGKPVTYSFDIPLGDVDPGIYTWAAGLVDTTMDNAIGINMAVNKDSLTDDGWAKITEVEIL